MHCVALEPRGIRESRVDAASGRYKGGICASAGRSGNFGLMATPRKKARGLKSAAGPRVKRVAPHIFVSLSPAKPTAVFDSYWHFAAERQRVFFARVAGESAPWTRDPILSTYKFTNAYRASDRV